MIQYPSRLDRSLNSSSSSSCRFPVVTSFTHLEPRRVNRELGSRLVTSVIWYLASLSVAVYLHFRNNAWSRRPPPPVHRQIVNNSNEPDPSCRPSNTKTDGRSNFIATPFINNVFDNYREKGRGEREREWTERGEERVGRRRGDFAFNSTSVMIQCCLTMNGGEDRTNTRRERNARD